MNFLKIKIYTTRLMFLKRILTKVAISWRRQWCVCYDESLTIQRYRDKIHDLHARPLATVFLNKMPNNLTDSMKKKCSHFSFRLGLNILYWNFFQLFSQKVSSVVLLLMIFCKRSLFKMWELYKLCKML